MPTVGQFPMPIDSQDSEEQGSRGREREGARLPAGEARPPASPERSVGSGAVSIGANLVVFTPLAAGTRAENRATFTPRKEKRVGVGNSGLRGVGHAKNWRRQWTRCLQGL